jgi:Putative beta-barrel porin 2
VKAETLLVVALLFVPGVAAGQALMNPVPTTAGPSLDISPRTPPPSTIPTAPEVVLPLPLPPTSRPVKIFDFRPTLGLSEEYSDNFNRSSQHPISNLRSMISPGGQVLVDTGFLTGQATYTLSAFHDSSLDQFGVHHLFAGDLAWQATPRLKFTLADTLTKSDNPIQADRLDLRLARQEFTSNLLSLGSAYALGLIDTTEYYRLSTFTSAQSTTTSQTIGATASTPLGRIHTVTLGYEYLDSETTVGRTGALTFFGPTADSTTTGHQVTASFSRDFSPDRTVGVTAAYAAREQTLATGRTPFTRWSVALFNNYVVPDKLVIRGNIGLALLDSAGSSGKPLLTSNSDITYYLGPLVLGLVLERGFAETFAQGQNFGIVETSGISGSVSYRYSPLLSGRLTGGYRENKFTGVGVAGQSQRDDTTVSATANVTYQVLRWLAATLDYTYTHTDFAPAQSGFAGFVENRIRAGLNMTLY